MLTIPQVAERFGLDTSLVTKWCNKGLFPNAYKDGGKWLIPEIDAETFAATRGKLKACERCGKEFKAWHPNGRYCSKQCRRAREMRRRYNKKRDTGLCAHCFRVPATDGHVLCNGCRQKSNERSKNRTKEQRARMSEWKKNWIAGKPDYYHETGQRSRQKLRREVFDHYGNRCACCGLEDWRFLTIDHIDGNGNKHRRETFNGKLVAGTDFYRWLRKNNYPEGFQLLCYNCNCAQSRFMGVCPHKLEQVQPNDILTEDLIK